MSTSQQKLKYFGEYTFYILSYGFTISADLVLEADLGVDYLWKWEVNFRIQSPINFFPNQNLSTQTEKKLAHGLRWESQDY